MDKNVPKDTIIAPACKHYIQRNMKQEHYISLGYFSSSVYIEYIKGHETIENFEQMHALQIISLMFLVPHAAVKTAVWPQGKYIPENLTA